MKMKSVKVDEDALTVLQDGKKAGGFASISAFLRHLFNLVGLSTFESANETQERRENRQKLDKIHELCKEIRSSFSPARVPGLGDVEIKNMG